ANEAGGVLVVAADLAAVDIELDHLHLSREGSGREPRADGEHEIARLDVLPEPALRPDAGAERQIAVIADGALALGRHRDRRLQMLGDLRERLERVTDDDAATRVDHGVLRGEEHL